MDAMTSELLLAETGSQALSFSNLAARIHGTTSRGGV